MLNRICFVVAIVLMCSPLWSQENTSAVPDTTQMNDDSRMELPPPVSGGAYPTEVGAANHSNYLRAGLTLNSTYSDNVLGGVSGNPVSDISYSIWPSISLDETTPRVHSIFSYNPGFTFYQRTGARNEADQNLSINFSYRLSPHLTLILQDAFHSSSNVLNQPDLVAANPVSGSPQASAVNVIAPTASQLNNGGNVELTYQFSLNGMVGLSGAFTNLHYPDPSQVPGLYDSSSKGGSAFYNHRLSKKNYLGVTYQYQDLLAYPQGFQAETQTDSVLFFYTAYLKPTFTLSFFGGPEYSNTQENTTSLRSWSPALGASLAWQGRETSLAIGYSRMIAPGGGLIGAVHQNAYNASIRRQLTRKLSVGVQGSYATNRLLEPALLSFLGVSDSGGHTVTGTVSLQRQIGERFGLGMGYTRLQQSYSNIAAISAAPNTNREWISISYQFARPLGR